MTSAVIKFAKHFRDVFGTNSNIYGGAFFENVNSSKPLTICSKKIPFIDFRLGSAYNSGFNIIFGKEQNVMWPVLCYEISYTCYNSWKRTEI